jgi:hypothetical protein
MRITVAMAALVLASTPALAQAPATKPATTRPLKPPFRIDAGATAESKDKQGNVWLADQGFKDGSTVERDAKLAIAGTDNPAIYRSERYGMTAFSAPVPNGKYVVKLHFAETSSAVDAAGGRVFGIKVEDVELKDFDVMKKAGAREKAHIEPVEVEVKDGTLDIAFTEGTQHTLINGIEVLPPER